MRFLFQALLLSGGLLFVHSSLADCPAPISVEAAEATQNPTQTTIVLSKSQADCSPASVITCKSGTLKVLGQVISPKTGTVQVAVTCGTKRQSYGVAEPPPTKPLRQQDVKNFTADPDSVEIRKPDPSRNDPGAKRKDEARALSQDVLDKAKAAGIPDVVLKRAYDNFVKLSSEKKTKRGCFMAGDLTTPAKAKIWLICMNPAKITAMDSYYGSGEGSGCYSHPYKNNDGCAKYFGNKEKYCLPAGGPYVTATASNVYNSERPFIELEGLDPSNSNAALRRVGVHQAVYHDGTPYNAKVGPEASQGCFTLPADIDFKSVDLSSSAAGGGMALYMYPAKQDIVDLINGKEVYWNKECKDKIVKPGWYGSAATDVFLDKDSSQKDELQYISDSPHEAATPDDAVVNRVMGPR